MSELKPGDLAMVVHYCCDKMQGAVVTVEQVFASTSTQRMHCLLCHKDYWGPALMAVTTENDLLPVAWLKKIEPLPESEREVTEQEVAA